MLDVRIADRLDPLVGVLVDLLSTPSGDAFATEWVAVPSIGMRRWLTQQLSARLGTAIGSDGVCANVTMPFPDELRRAVLAADLGSGPAAPADPWEPERLVWPVLETLVDPSLADHPRLSPLSRPPEGSSLVGRAQAVAELLDRYCRHRPDMVRAWVDGRSTDPLGAPIGPGHAWQPELFRLVRERVGVPSPPERLARALERVASGELRLDLPDRLALFGMSTLPTGAGPVVRAVAEHHDVAVLLFTASQPATEAVAERVRGSGLRAPIPRRDDPTGDLARNPLLRSWGAAGREAAVALAAAGVHPDLVPPSPVQMTLDLDAPAVDAPGGDVGGSDDPSPEPAGTLLARLQADIRADRAPDRSFERNDDDRSVQVHACSGPTRQVEVLRDAVLHLLAEDPDLTEADVVILCPRIEEFAPIIEAVFGPSADAVPDHAGQSTGDPVPVDRAPLLRYRITDRRLRADVPLLGVLGALLDVLPGRFTASAVADLLALGPVSDRFGLEADDLALLDEWIRDANIRWGIDGPHRSSWHLPAAHQANSWSAGLDQLLMGAAVRGDHLTLAVGEVAPLAVADSAVRTAARVAEAVRTLAAIRDDVVDTTATVADWCELLADAIDRVCSLPWAESWQRRRLDRVLSQLRDRSLDRDGRPSRLALRLPDVRRLVGDLLVGDPARAAFGTGAVTCCSLSPLRSVPAAVVCLLGLDQDALPRGLAQGDDLLAAHPAVGDRDPRTETRQLLLEAVLSAGTALVVTHDSVDVRTNLPVPPAVVLDELLDVVGDTCVDGGAARAAVRFEHPRHGFDPRNFAEPAPWGFDPSALSGALSLRDRAPAAGSDLLVPEPLAPLDAPEVLSLDRLRAAMVEPVRELLTERLGVVFRRVEDGGVDHLPTDLGGLDRHRVGTDLLRARAQGLDVDRWLHAARARGALPPGPLSEAGMEIVTRVVAQIERSAVELGVGLDPSERCDVDLDVAGRRLVGVVERCVDGPRPGPVRLEMSKAKPGQRIRAVVDLLSLVAVDPEQDWRAVVIRQTTKAKAPRADELVLAPAGDTPAQRRELALAALERLVAFRDAALRQAVPVVEKTGWHLARGDYSKAAGEWNDRAGAYPMPGEGSSAHIRAAFGSLDFDGLLSLRVDGRSAQQHAAELWAALDSAVVEEEP